jgi:hypothetical protein
MKDLGAYIDAAIATIRAQLNPVIVAANTANPGLPALPQVDPTRVLFGGDESGAIGTYPSIEVAAADRRHHGFSLNVQDWDVEPVIAVRAWLAYDANINAYQALYRANMRYGRLLAGVLLAKDAFGPSVTIVELQERYRTADPQSNSREDVTAAGLLIWRLDDVDGP